MLIKNCRMIIDGEEQFKDILVENEKIVCCDFLVVGRPITKHEDPALAARLVVEEIEEGLKEAGKC